MKKVFFISNGESYSDFSVYGGVIAEDNELPVLEAILRYAIVDVDETFKNWQKVWADHRAAGGKHNDPDMEEKYPYPDTDPILIAAFAKHGFTFTPYNDDLVVP